jgi:hypothetical protein
MAWSDNVHKDLTVIFNTDGVDSVTVCDFEAVMIEGIRHILPQSNQYSSVKINPSNGGRHINATCWGDAELAIVAKPVTSVLLSWQKPKIHNVHRLRIRSQKYF